MNKRIRVFLLSMLVIMLSVSSALADDNNTITFTLKGSPTNAWRLASNWDASPAFSTLSSDIKKLFDESVQEQTYYPGGIRYVEGATNVPKIIAIIPNDANLNVNGSLTGPIDLIQITAHPTVNYVGNVVLNLGTSNMKGKLDLFISKDAKVTISGTGVLNVSDDLGDVSSWDVGGNLTVDVPVKFGRHGLIINKREDERPNVTNTRSLIINKDISRQFNTGDLTVNMKLRTTLTAAHASILNDYSTLNIASYASVVFNVNGSNSPTINLSQDATINVGSGYTVTLTPGGSSTNPKGIRVSSSFNKAGAGTLRFLGSLAEQHPPIDVTTNYPIRPYYVQKGVLDLNSTTTKTTINVNAGTLTLSAAVGAGSDGQPEGRYPTSRDVKKIGATPIWHYDYTPAITVGKNEASLDLVVGNNATLNVGTYSVREVAVGSGERANTVVKVKVNNGGIANIEEMGIFRSEYRDTSKTTKGSSLYAASSDQYGKPNITSNVTFDVSGTLNLKGSQAVRKIENSNTVGNAGRINVDSGKELIIVLGDNADSGDLRTNYYGFYGTISADSVGLIGKFVDYPFNINAKDRSRVTANINTLKVYGGSELILDDTINFDANENIYLRRKQPPTSTSFSSLEVGKLTITSGEVKIPGTLRIDGAGLTKGVSIITLSKDANKSKGPEKPTLNANTLAIHANESEVTSALYEAGLAFVASGDGTVIVNTVTGDPSNAHPDSAVRVTGGATLKLNGAIPSHSGITVNENSTLDVAENVAIPGNLDLNENAILKATLTAANATDASSTYAVNVTGSLTMTRKLSVDVTLNDTELTGLPTTYGRTYKVIGTAKSSDIRVVISGDIKRDASFDVELTNSDTKDLFKKKGTMGDEVSSYVVNDKNGGSGIALELGANIQQVALGDASFDKENFGANKQFTLTIPVTYSSSFRDHYKNYIWIPSTSMDIRQNGVRARASYSAATGLVTVAGTSENSEAEIEIAVGWNKGNDEQLETLYGTLGSNRNSSVATAVDDEVSKRHWVEIDGLKLNFFIPAKKKIKLEGAAKPTPAETATVVNSIDVEPTENKFTVDPSSADSKLKLTITGLRIAPTTTGSLPVLVNGVYVWNNGYDTTKTYQMLSSDGSYQKVDPVVVVVNGNKLSTAEMDNVTIEAAEGNANATLVTIPVSLIASNTDAEGTQKTLAVQGTLPNGKEVKTPNITVSVSKNDLGTEEVDGGTATADSTGKVTDFTSVTLTVSSDMGTVTSRDWSAELPGWLTAVPSNTGYELLLNQDYTGTVTAGPVTINVVARGTNGTRTYRVAINVVVAPDKKFGSIIAPSNATQSVENGSALDSIVLRASDDVPVSWDVGTGAPSWLTTSGNNTAEFTLSGTPNEATVPATYAFTVTASAGGVTDTANISITVVEPVMRVVLEDVGDVMTEGYNYRAVYTAQNTSGRVTWTLTPADSWLKAVPSGNNQVVIEGRIPDYDDSEYGENDPNEYAFTIAANGAEPVEFTVTVEENTDTVADGKDISFVEAADGTELDTVAEDYSVTITLPEDAVGYLDPDDIDIPSWLICETTTNNDGEITAVTIKRNPDAVNIPVGSEGSVHIPISGTDYDAIGWNVTYNVAPAALGVSVNPSTLAVQVGTMLTAQATATGATGTVTYALSGNPSWVVIDAATGEITANAPATPLAAVNVTVTATDSVTGATGQGTFSVSAVGGQAEFSVTVSESDREITVARGASRNVALTPVGADGAVTYAATVNGTEINWVTFSGNNARIAPTATTATSNYTVVITATNAGRQDSVTLTVRVTEPEPQVFSVSASRSSVSINLSSGDRTATVTLTPRNNSGTVTYSAAVNGTAINWVTFSGNTATFAPTRAGNYTVAITARDAAGNTSTANITVTVTGGGSVGSSGGGCDAGFGALALVLAAPLFLRRRRS